MEAVEAEDLSTKSVRGRGRWVFDGGARGQARKGGLSEGDESVAEAGRDGLLSAG